MTAEPKEYAALRCQHCGHWEKGAFTKEQVAQWLRVHVSAGIGPNAERLTCKSTCPHPCGTNPYAPSTDLGSPYQIWEERRQFRTRKAGRTRACDVTVCTPCQLGHHGECVNRHVVPVDPLTPPGVLLKAVFGQDTETLSACCCEPEPEPHPPTPDPLAVVAKAVAELDLEHKPAWFSDAAEAAGKAPIGCYICFPHDGSWPCVTRRIADDLRALLSEPERAT